MPKNAKTSQYLIYGGIVILIVAIAIIIFGGKNNSATTTNRTVQTQEQPAQKSTTVSASEDNYPMAPDFELPDLDGKNIKLSDLKGKVVFLNFWATWCPPCKREIPGFINLVNKYGKDGFIVLGVAVDPREFDKVKPFAKQIGINYPVVYDKKGVSQLYGGIRSIPTTFVINREGKVVGQIVGSRPEQTFESIIKSLL